MLFPAAFDWKKIAIPYVDGGTIKSSELELLALVEVKFLFCTWISFNGISTIEFIGIANFT